MKDFFSHTFSGLRASMQRRQQAQTPPGKVAEIPGIVERVVDGTDGRIRLVSGYRKKLQDIIRSSLAFADELVEHIPGAIEVNRHTFVSDPYVNAFFANVSDMRAIFSRSSEIKEFLEGYGDNAAMECCTLLCMHMSEKTVMGVELSGDVMKREVRQVAVNFSDHRIYSPAPHEEGTRQGLKQCLFDGLVTNALERITRLRLSNYRLKSELQVLKARQRRYQQTLQRSEDSTIRREYEAVCSDLERLEAELSRIPLATPQAALEQVITVFSNPEQFVQMRKFSLRLSKMGILIEGETTQPCNDLELTEVSIGESPPRIVTLARFPHSEILPAGEDAQRSGYSSLQTM